MATIGLKKFNRRLAFCEAVDKPPAIDADYDENTNTTFLEGSAGYPGIGASNLVTSIATDDNANPLFVPNKPTDNATAVGDNVYHYPVIDIDVSCELVPSSNFNHYHLYINKAISWTAYKALLNAMVGAGIVEVGYRNAALSKGFTGVRHRGKFKPTTPRKYASVIKTNVMLNGDLFRTRSKLFDARAENIELKNKLAALNDVS